MNALPSFLVRPALLAAFAILAFPCSAQRGDESLTSDFSRLSAKERSRIAAKETEEAAKDTSYQALMHKADNAFQAGRYQEALATFQQARVLRPYNVYPKVKIEDLQALIRKKEQENKVPAPPEALPEDTTARPVKAPPALVPEKVQPTLPEEEKPVPAPAPTPLEERVPASLPRHPQPLPPAKAAESPPARAIEPPAPAVMGERIYREAGAVVTERTVEDDGKAVVYRKVVHPWGQTFYFQDGRAILQREWDQRFSGQ